MFDLSCYLNGNKLYSTEGLSGLKELDQLDLSFNGIQSIEDLNIPSLRKLSLRKNPIKSLNGIAQLEKLTELDILFNSLSSLDELLELPHLNEVTIGKEKYGDPVIKSLKERGVTIRNR